MTTVDILYPSSQAMEVFKKQEGEPQLSHFCKICSKRFVSGRALGGHMRAHAPASASIAADTLIETEFGKSKRPRASDQKSMEEREKDEEGLDSNGSNPMYALRRNPKRSWRFADQDYSFLLGEGIDSKSIDSSIRCDLCAKEFSSWESLFDHMKYHSETHEDSSDAHLEESRQQETQTDEDKESESDAQTEMDHPSGNSIRFDKCMKGKRSKRSRYAIQLNPHEQFDSDTTTEEKDMAMCLVMLASGVNTAQNPQFRTGAEEPGSGDLKLPHSGSQLLECIRKKPTCKKIDRDAGVYDDEEEEVKKARYKCTTCNKFFHSHYALGGHRASHSKVKGFFSQREEENESLEEEITDEEVIHGPDSQLPGNFHKPSPKEKTKEVIHGPDSQLPGNFHKPSPKENTKDSCVKARDETTTIEAAATSEKKTPRVHECSICHRIFASGQALGGHKRCHWGSAGASDSVSTTSSNKENPMEQAMPARVGLLDLNLPAPVDDNWDAENLNNLVSNAVDCHGVSSDAQTYSSPCLQSWLMGSYPKQGLLLYNSHTHFSKVDESENKTGKKNGFGRGCESEFSVRAGSWLQL